LPTYTNLFTESLVPLPRERLAKLAQLSKALASLTSLMPRILGSSASSLLAIAARRMGRELAREKHETLSQALAELSRASAWRVELLSYGGSEATLVVRECPVRQVCFFEGMSVGGALCATCRGLLEGYIHSALGVATVVATLGAGPNACVCRVRPRFGGEQLRVGEVRGVSEGWKQGLESYVDKVEGCLSRLIELTYQVLEKGVGRQAIVALSFSARRFGAMRSLLYERCSDLECVARALAREVELPVRARGSSIEIEGCPIKRLGLDGVCRSLTAFIEGFASELLGKSVRVSSFRRGDPACVIDLEVGS